MYRTQVPGLVSTGRGFLLYTRLADASRRAPVSHFIGILFNLNFLYKEITLRAAGLTGKTRLEVRASAGTTDSCIIVCCTYDDI